MSMEFVGLDRILRAFSILPQETANAGRKSMAEALVPIQRELTYDLSNQLLRRRTGRLVTSIAILGSELISGSIQGIIKVGGANRIGANVEYARILNDGGTITPKKARYLTIPSQFAQTAAGVARFTAPQVIDNPEEFGYTGTFFRNHVLFGTKGKRTRSIVPLFFLKDSVTIRGRHFVEDALKKGEPKAFDIFHSNLGNRLRALGL